MSTVSSVCSAASVYLCVSFVFLHLPLQHKAATFKTLTPVCSNVSEHFVLCRMETIALSVWLLISISQDGAKNVCTGSLENYPWMVGMTERVIRIFKIIFWPIHCLTESKEKGEIGRRHRGNFKLR